MVKLYQVEHAQEVYVVVDSSRLSAREQILESYVTAALHLALAAERQGDRFGLVTFSDRPHRLVRARSGMDHFRLCRETIYNLQRAARESRFSRGVHQSAGQSAPPRAADLLHFARRSAAGRDFRARSVAAGAPPPGAGERDAHRRIAAAVRGRCAGRSGSAYQALAGQMLWNKMRELQIALRNHGVRLRWSIREHQGAGHRGVPGNQAEAVAVILDLPRFVATERAYWDELQALLDRLRLEPDWRMSIPEIERLHYLYERCSADLVRLDTFSTEPQLRGVCGIAGIARLCGDPRDARTPPARSAGALSSRRFRAPSGGTWARFSWRWD